MNTNASKEEVAKPFDFRKVNWEMSKKEVEEIEGITFSKSPNILKYSLPNVAGQRTDLYYYFHLNKLIRAVYVFGKDNSYKYQFYNDFDTIGNILISKYGAPTQYKEDWVSEEKKKEYEKRGALYFGNAVATENLTRFRIWNKGRTIISEYCLGEEKDVGIEFVRPKSSVYHIVEYKFSELDRVKKETSAAETYSDDL